MRTLIALLLLCGAASAQVSMTSPTATVPAFGVPSSTVSGLPTCNAASNGQIITVTNALTPALAVAVVGGGAVSVLVHCNGTSWIVG
jgi:hypothetical protein